MGTYDTRSGGPISPNEPDPVITQDEEEALGVLEALDKARDDAEAVLQPLFKRIMVKRYPIGSEVDIRRIGRVLYGHAYGMTKGIVDSHRNEMMNWSTPESMSVLVVVRLLNKQGECTKHNITVKCSITNVFGNRAERDQLCIMIAALSQEEPK